ncbi:shikimate kinase AroK [Barrientosiimonas marina]|uniref:Shikimate kinase n=1 Tax=Lentibacillus kimchii TaxID=1542911 RepID=A0ABW2UYE9_9BACI
MKTLYLIGFMGSGKSTVGDWLKQKSARFHLDTDQMIVDQYGEIASIFKAEGESVFRSYETEMLARVPERNYVISTGGGIVERKENHMLMKNNGLIIFLDTSFAEVLTRLGEDVSRPLWGQADHARYNLYKRRYPVYRSLADMTVHTDQKTPDIIAADIMERLPQSYV